MNVLLNTPFLTSSHLKKNFDDKILAIFLLLIAVLVLFGALFIDTAKSSAPSFEEEPSAPSRASVYV
ncbi:hypothetical protein HYS95_01105 [Candidatus Daviesbacteria bacterium]|nr:hypothetical protein [Candidatus Daviesbacteria bacterium]